MTEQRPYGQIKGLPLRVADWVHRAKYDKSLPWIGLGLIDDMETVVKLLCLEEFGKWLLTHSDDELQRWGTEVLEAADDREALTELMADIEEVVPVAAEQPYAEAVTAVAAKAIKHDVTRAVLVELGALSADDTETSIPDLLRVLLS